jgi:hypothetical protein
LDRYYDWIQAYVYEVEGEVAGGDTPKEIQMTDKNSIINLEKLLAFIKNVAALVCTKMGAISSLPSYEQVVG